MVRDCLNMTMSNEDMMFKQQDFSENNVNDARVAMNNQLQLNGYVGV